MERTSMFTNITRMLLKSLLKQLAGLIPNVVAQLIDVARERNFKASTNNNHETGGINNHKSEGGKPVVYGKQHLWRSELTRIRENVSTHKLD